MKTPRPTKYCRMCLKLFSMYPSQQHQKYCSNACAYAAFHLEGWAKAKPKITSSCETCGKTLINSPERASRVRFCSQKCMIVRRSKDAIAQNAIEGNQITCTCKQCGKSFVRYRSAIKYGRGVFCGKQCHGTYTIHQKRQRVSKIEKKFGDMLEHEGLNIQRSYRIGPWVCDFYVPSVNLVIEFDGKYWHSLPAMIKRDKRKDEYLLAQGYRISRVQECSLDGLACVAMNLSRIHGGGMSSLREQWPGYANPTSEMIVRVEA